MHQYIIEAIKAIIAGKLDDAKSLLDKIINHDEDLQSNSAIAFYLSSYIAYLENIENKCSDYFNLIEPQYLGEFSSIDFFTPTKKPATSSTPTPLASPKVNGAMIIRRYSTEQIVNSLSQSPQLQSSIASRSTMPLIFEPIEQFKKCDEFWQFVLSEYLSKIKIPQESKEANQPSIDNVIITAKNCKIPLFFLCQNLKTLTRFWGENGNFDLSKPVTPLLLPRTPDLIIQRQKPTPSQPPPTTGGLKKLLSTSNGSTTPSLLADRITPSPSMTSNSSTPRSSSSSNHSPSIKNEKEKVEATKVNHPAITSVYQDQKQHRNVTKPMLSESQSTYANKDSEQANLMSCKVVQAQVTADTYVPSNALDDEDDEINFFRLNNHDALSTLKHKKDKRLKDNVDHPVATPKPIAKIKSTPLADHLLAQHNITNTPSIKPAAVQHHQNGDIATNQYIKEQENAKLDNQKSSSSKDEKLAKNRTMLKKGVTYNNCLATILWYLSGVRDIAITAENNDAIYTDRTAIEIAANYGYIHCLSFMTNATNDMHYLGRALKQAVIFEHDNCIQLLLTKPIHFDEAAETYVLLKNKNNPKLDHYMEYLLSNFINLTAALSHNHKDLIFELANGTGKETIYEKQNIILKASELGYDCCLTEYMLNGIDQTTLEFAILNTLKFNHDGCLKILLKQAITSATRVAILFNILQYLAFYYKQEPPDKLFNLFDNNNSFRLALSILSDLDKDIAFLQASETANELYLKLLLKHGNISKEAKTKALFNLCGLMKIDCVLILLNNGITRDKEKEAIQLMTRNRSEMVLPHLMSHAYTNHYLLTLLYDLKLLPKNNSLLAALTKRREIASLNFLLNMGYDINGMHSEIVGEISKCTGTALMVASYYGDCETLDELLTDRQNNLPKPDLSLQLPENCHFYYQIETAAYSSQQSSSLLQMSQQPKKINKLNIIFSGYSALHFAASHSSTACLRSLLRKIPINSKLLNLTNSIDETALHVAAAYNRFQTVTLLLKHKADVNKCNQLGDNPLLSAVRRGHYQTVLAFAENPIMFTDNFASKLALIDTEAALQKNIEAQISVIACLLSAKINWPNKVIVDERKAKEFQNKLVTLFTLIIEQNNENALPIIINCLFSNSLNWPSYMNKDNNMFMECMNKLIEFNNIDGIQSMKPYLSEFIEFSDKSDNYDGDLLEMLSPVMRSMLNTENFINLLKKALNPFKIRWECAKILLLAVSTEDEKNQVADLTNDEAVRKLLELKKLLNYLIETPSSLKRLKPPS